MSWVTPLALLGFLTGLLRISNAFEVTLLDTRREESLGWVTNADSDTPRIGWRERSFNSQGDVFRVYTVCNIDVNDVDNWLRTPYILRGEANRLYIEMRFTMRQCTKYPDPGRLQQCKESVKLLYYEMEGDHGNAMRPTWDDEAYHHIDVIAADKVYTDVSDTVINTETRSVAISRRGVYFAFQDQGACMSLLSVRIYYIVCPSVSLNFAVFPNTTTGMGISSITRQEGVCVAHAAIEQPPSNLCAGDGTWKYSSGGCKCMPGYEPEGNECKPCPIGHYKWRTGSESCRVCPGFSEASDTGSVECQCREGFYRSLRDDKSVPCTQPPSAVRNMTVLFRDQSMINLSWERPMEVGGRRDLVYVVECADCGRLVTYHPAQTTNSTKVSLLGLNPDTEYIIKVTAENGVSYQSGKESSKVTVIHTEKAIPTKVRRLRVSEIGRSHVTLTWDAPGEPPEEVNNYEIKFYMTSWRENASQVQTKLQNATFKNLVLATEYAFQVRAQMAQGWGEFSDPVYAKTGSSELVIKDKMDTTPPPDNPIGIIAGSAVAVVVCMVIVIIMIIILLRRNHRSCHEKNVSDCDTLQYSNVQCPHILEGPHIMNGSLTMPLFTPPGGVKTYVDPHTYEDPNQAVREFTKEIDVSCITIESVIGGGEFGDVCKGKLKVAGKGDLTVAIKTLKAGASDKNRLDFLTEASIMGQFDDPNVIYLEGVITKSNPIMIVTEYMENGSLDTFLRNNDGKFTVIQLVGMMRGIASGMRYLSEMGYVHRDLAARNILVNENLVCKVADFGLSREIESDDTDGAYTTKGGKIPVRWTAPEAIAYRKFTSASDVWSYGVVTWEVMSFGERPYWNWSNHDVIKAVDKGFRLPPPMDCPESIYQLLLDCWQKERSHRPKFSAIVKTLDKLIRAPELLRKIAKPRPDQLLDPNTPDLTSFESIEQWLNSLKMERYLDHFVQSGYSSMEQVAQITLKDLFQLGITLVGHQKKIMNSVQTLRAQLYGAQVSDGFLV